MSIKYALFAALVLSGASHSTAFASRIVVPDTIDSGQTVSVAVDKPDAGSRIEVWGPVTQTGKGRLILTEPMAGAKTGITFDLPAGSYQLRHIGSGNNTLATAPIDVSAHPVTLSTDGSVDPSAQFPVTWRGPALEGDRLRIVSAGSNVALTEVLAGGTSGETNVLFMPAPAEKGTYELQYVTAGDAVLQSLPVTVSAGRNWMRSPIGVSTGQEFDVSWHGAVLADHIYRLATTSGEAIAEAPLTVVDGAIPSVKFQAPDEPGSYLVQLVDRASGAIVTSLPLDVDS